MKLWSICFAVVLALCTGSASAITKCTSPSGKITFQDFPCGAPTDPQRMGPAAPVKGTYAAPNPIKKAPPEALAMLVLYRRWVDAEQLAIAVDRPALVGPIASMQTIQREIEVIQIPKCLAKSRTALLVLVKNTTTTMLDFMARTGTADLKFFFVERTPLINQFERALRFAPCPGYNAG